MNSPKMTAETQRCAEKIKERFSAFLRASAVILDFYRLRICISHWLLALLLFVPPLWKLNRLRKA